MGIVHAEAEGVVGGPPARVYEVLADYKQHHPKIVPDEFTEFSVEEGGVGAGTIFRFRMIAGGRNRICRMKVDEPEPGRVLREADLESTLVTTFTVVPEGDGSRVKIVTRWTGAKGIGGFFERLFAPRVLRRLYRVELGKLDAYVRGLPDG